MYKYKVWLQEGQNILAKKSQTCKLFYLPILQVKKVKKFNMSIILRGVYFIPLQLDRFGLPGSFLGWQGGSARVKKTLHIPPIFP